VLRSPPCTLGRRLFRLLSPPLSFAFVPASVTCAAFDPRACRRRYTFPSSTVIALWTCRKIQYLFLTCLGSHRRPSATQLALEPELCRPLELRARPGHASRALAQLRIRVTPGSQRERACSPRASSARARSGVERASGPCVYLVICCSCPTYASKTWAVYAFPSLVMYNSWIHARSSKSHQIFLFPFAMT
jgi:hypothetical protein